MKKVVIFCAAAAMALSASFDAYAVNVGKIVVKRGNADTVYKAKHQIIGMADPGAEFKVNGKSVKAYKTGTWGVELQLQPGDNKITIDDNGAGTSFNVFYSTTPKPAVKDLAKEAAEAEKLKFYPTSLTVETKKYA